jgi:hypothetical protein
MCKDSLVDISDQVRTKVKMPSHLPTPEQVLIGTSTGPAPNPKIIQESKTNQPQEWPEARVVAAPDPVACWAVILADNSARPAPQSLVQAPRPCASFAIPSRTAPAGVVQLLA